MANTNPVRRLPFSYGGEDYEVKAAPGMDGWDLGLFKGGQRMPGEGKISADDILDAQHTNPGVDLVGEGMAAIRDGVLTSNVRDDDAASGDDA